MAHFAKVENGIVTQVIVIDQETLNTGLWGDPASWIQTSYNTQSGKHTAGGPGLRKNFAGIGFTYDAQRDAFIPPKTFDSWVLNEETCLWEAPIPVPTDDKPYRWDEAVGNWVVVVPKPPVPDVPAEPVSTETVVTETVVTEAVAADPVVVDPVVTNPTPTQTGV